MFAYLFPSVLNHFQTILIGNLSHFIGHDPKSEHLYILALFPPVWGLQLRSFPSFKARLGRCRLVRSLNEGSEARARQRAKVLKAVPLPPLSLDTVMSHDCFIVDMDGLAQLCQCKAPLDIKDVSGNTLLHAAVSHSVDGLFCKLSQCLVLYNYHIYFCLFYVTSF